MYAHVHITYILYVFHVFEAKKRLRTRNEKQYRHCSPLPACCLLLLLCHFVCISAYQCGRRIENIKVYANQPQQQQHHEMNRVRRRRQCCFQYIIYHDGSHVWIGIPYRYSSYTIRPHGERGYWIHAHTYHQIMRVWVRSYIIDTVSRTQIINVMNAVNVVCMKCLSWRLIECGKTLPYARLFRLVVVRNRVYDIRFH